MVDKIIELSNQLREAGIPVSVRSTQAASEVYLNDSIGKNTLKTALRAIYVKDKYDLAKFNMVFLKNNLNLMNLKLLRIGEKHTLEMDLNQISM